MQFNLFDVVTLNEDVPELRLQAGQAGTVVELLSANAYEVEFSDKWGNVIASRGFRAEQLRPDPSPKAEAQPDNTPTRA